MSQCVLHGDMGQQYFSKVIIFKLNFLSHCSLLKRRGKRVFDSHAPNEYISGVSWPTTHKDIPGPCHGRVYSVKSFALFMWWRVFEACPQIGYLTGKKRKRIRQAASALLIRLCKTRCKGWLCLSVL